MDWLSEQCRRIQEQKLKQERSIRYLKQLFKAWPVKAEPEEDISERETSSKGAEKITRQVEKCDDRLTVEEKEGLLMMDKLLSKAQKARDLQKKLEEPKKPRNVQSLKQKNQSDNSLNQNDKIGAENTDMKELQKKPQEVANVSNVTSKVSQEMVHHTNTAPRNKLVSNVKPQSNRTNKTKCVEKVERQKICQRPQSSSGTGKVVPAHVSAPFQTNPNLLTAKIQTTYKATTAKTLAKSRGAGSAGSRGRESKGSAREATIASRCKSSKTDDKKFKQTNMTEVDLQDNNSVNMDAEKRYGTESAIKGDSNSDVESLKAKLDATSIEADQDTSATKLCESNEKKDKLFFLKRDGANLSVPVRLKKLVYQNKKFRQKLYAQTVTQKVRSSDTFTEFPQYLKYAFGGEDDQLIQLQAKQARHIANTYTSLLNMLDNLHLDHISADSDPADVYFTKKMVEHILLTFQEMEQNLHKSDFTMLSKLVVPPTRTSVKLPQAQPSSMSVWYEKNIVTGNHCPPKVFQYGSYKILEKYMDTVYQVQLLQLHIDLMDTIARLLFPLLQTLDPSTSEFARVLRAGYSLMSINHNNQPVVVMDTIQDESTLQQED